MATFKSIIEVIGDGSYANEIVDIRNKSTVGNLTEDVVVVGDVAEGEIDPTLYTAYEISKVQWETSDGKFYSDNNITHKFASKGVYQVKLTIWSEPFLTNDGRTFYFTHSSFVDVIIESKILKFFLQYNPTWDLIKNDAAHDFFKASANFFEKIYRDTAGLVDMWDAERINPKFFEYMSLTLGHSSEYSKKIGYVMSQDDFETFDIYDLIKKGVASKEQIQSFRRFLMLSSDLFRKKGTPDGIEKFLSLFTIDAKVIELWTENWGQTPVGEIDESFIGFDIEDNEHGFVWKNIRVVGNCITEKGYIRKNLSSITLDNYHDIEKIQYPSAVVSYVDSGVKTGWEEMEIEKSAPYVYDIRTEDGNILVDEEQYQIESDVYDIVPNDPPRSDETKHGVFQLKPEAVEIGDRIVVAYYGTEDSIFDSMLATKEKTSKDCDIRAKFIFKEVVDPNKFESFKYPEKEVFIVFRGIQSNTDLYATFDEYYKVSINGTRGTASLVKVIGNANGQSVNQKLNVSGNRNAPVHDIQIFKEDDISCPTEMKYDTYYELEVSVAGSLVSAYLYENDVETAIQNNIDSDTGGNPYGVKTCKEPIVLFENISLEQDSAQIHTNDSEGNDVVDRKYTFVNTAGHYGFGIRASIVELKDFYINNLDADETLYTTTEKEFNLMPKYLNYRKTKLLRYNNYSDGMDNFYNKTVVTDFNPQVTDYEVNSNSMSMLYADNVAVDEAVATRYTVTFDETWMKETFDDVSELTKKIIIPYGDQRRWFVPDLRFQNKEVFRNYFGDYRLTSGNTIIPGLFRYNNSPVLDTYDLEPEDSLSRLDRVDESLTFTANQRLVQYLYSKNALGLRGIFQEVCPHSGNFNAINDNIVLPDNTIYKNPVFHPITVDTSYGVRIVGVRFKNCDDIERLISVNSTSLYKSVQLYGHFTMDVTAESIRYCPDKTAFQPHPTQPDTYVVSFFVPLGVLDKNRRTYALNSEFLQLEENAGSDLLDIRGIYVRNPKDLINYRESENTFTLDDILKNPYEDAANNLFCKYFISGQVKLSTGVQAFDYGMDFPTSYIMGNDVRNLLTGIEQGLRAPAVCETKPVTYSYDEDYKWWIPKTIWRKRDIVRGSVSYGSDILSGINYKKNQFDKFFYNLKIDAGAEKPRSLSFIVTDGPVNKNTVYYAKINVNMDYSGFAYSEISKTSEISNPIDSEELSNLSVRGTKAKYSDFKRSPVATCLTFYVPFSWYPEAPANNTIEWFNYIVGSAGDSDNEPSISITPIGLMTYLINNAGDANKSNSIGEQELLNVTRGWTMEEWNSLFDTNIDVEFIAEEVPKDKYKLFNKYIVLPDYPINVGTEIKINYNVADTQSTGWTVFDTYTIYAKSDNQKVYELPAQLKSIRRWAEDVHEITINKLVIPTNSYDVVSNSLIRLNSTPLVKSLAGGDIIARYFFDLVFDDNTVIKKEDDFLFNKERTINLLPYEADISRTFESSNRLPNENLVFRTRDNIYNIENIDNQLVFKSINKNSAMPIDFGRSGIVDSSDNEVTFTKKVQDNILKLYAIDDNNTIFDTTAYFKFDKKMDSMKNYDGKKFEFILKASTVFDPIKKKHILGGYYFVGVGVYGFDIGLGIARYNSETGKMEKSFLAGFGEYNTRGVNVDTWYKLRAIVTEDFIRVIFNEKIDEDRLVINYNISKEVQNQPSRYIDGSFEELVYIITGLDKMSLTYPGKLGEKTSAAFVTENFNEELVKSFRPSGTLTGVVFHNEMTYMEKLEYISQIQGDTVFGDAHDTKDGINYIDTIYNMVGSKTIDYIGRTTNNTLVIQSGNYLFYQSTGRDLNLYGSNVKEAHVNGEYVVISYTNDNMEIVDQNFTEPISVYVKDLTFHVDHIFNYLKFTNRKINKVWNGKDKVYVQFCDLPDCT